MISNTDYNWEAISAISNTVLSILTLVAIGLTLYTVRVSYFPKGKLMFRKARSGAYDFYDIKFINMRNTHITIIHRGYFIKDKENKDLILESKNNISKLEVSDIDYFSTAVDIINEKLLDLGKAPGEDIGIHGFFVTGTSKVFKKKLKHRVYSKPKPTLNKEALSNGKLF